ncbi:hypothetical protein DCC85_04590 [Paenibacillus sp. CAA11]|nr:hypothetical protein DCC85_04590 [Paenibacillus sp. CAA11]
MRNRSSVCAIGLVEVKDGQIVREFYSLINPQDSFDPFCTAIHGITADHVTDAPTFSELWPTLRDWLASRPLVAHNASFDMSVLRSCIERMGLTFEGCSYLCSYLLSKRVWPGLPSYRLNHMARHLKLDTFKHHDALEDARTAALLFLECLEASGSTECQDIADRFGYRLGMIHKDGSYQTFTASRSSSSRKPQTLNLRATVDHFDPSHQLYEKNVVFTGTLGGMTRREAMQKVVDLGGRCSDAVAEQTHYLVIGQKDYMKHLEGLKSSRKLQKAEKLAAMGYPVTVLPESDFLSLLG